MQNHGCWNGTTMNVSGVMSKPYCYKQITSRGLNKSKNCVVGILIF